MQKAQCMILEDVMMVLSLPHSMRLDTESLKNCGMSFMWDCLCELIVSIIYEISSLSPAPEKKKLNQGNEKNITYMTILPSVVYDDAHEKMEITHFNVLPMWMYCPIL